MDIFGKDVQKAMLWLKRLQKIGRFRDEAQAYSVLRVVLHALRDRLPLAEVIHLGAQMPLIIRGMYYDGINITKVSKEKTFEEFKSKIMPELLRLEVTLDDAVRSVFVFIRDTFDMGQLQHIRDVLPKHLKDLLWGEGNIQEDWRKTA